jgi:iron(III) transport system substrate-binding protein
VLTVDVARLDELKRAGLTQRLDDAPLDAEIPAKFRDGEKHWFGVSMDARGVYASKARVKENTITYEELADPKWKGKVCLREGQHSSNLALFASMIAVHGQQYTETWLTGLRNNLARRPNGSDRTQARAIMEGRCDIGIGNTFFIAAMLTDEHSPDEKGWAEAVRVIYPNAGDRGTHVNIYGMALARHAPNRDNAVKLMEFLASRDAQEIYSRTALEYPVAPGAAPADVLAAFGPLKPDAVALSEIARYREQAADLVETSEFNEGPAD